MSYDVVVIGSGPGGYGCAIKAAQIGLKIAVVEKRPTFGGTCLNVGCIPSKALLYASEVYAEVNRGFDELGFKVSKPNLDLIKMMDYKQLVIDSNTNGVAFLFKKNKIDAFIGMGKILATGKVEVTAENGTKQILKTRNIVIATGSDIAAIPGVEVDFDEKVIVSSTGALSFEEVPQSIIIVGAGVIGSELGSVWHRLGAKVEVIEFLDKALGTMDGEISKQFQKLMEKQGISYKFGAKVIDVKKNSRGAVVTFKKIQSDEVKKIEADVVLVATGRCPYTEGVGLQTVGVALDECGRVKIDGHWRTNVRGIYAIGDVVKGPMLAHKAASEGITVAEVLAGQAGDVNFDVIPSVVYTQPEVASVGRTEEELRAAGIKYKIGKFPFTASGRARAMMHTDGFVKILACSRTDRVLGGHILGFGASEMIHEIAILMEFGGSSEDLGRTCHAHPTMSEAVREAALAIFAKPIHL
ncbi:MAG: dihydrolipoamide dehydrogenase [Candidatus Tokpelaia sp. JSC188]|nr:MAG: dihydrolipoamide dehydrogenase [Candidatus Tokpelaia sp. JSC188]